MLTIRRRKTKIVPISRCLASQTLCCEASTYWDSARKRLVQEPRICPSTHICYERRHLHPRLLMESAENKFGTVQSLENTKNVFSFFFFWEYRRQKPIDTHLASHYVQPSVARYELVTLPYITLNEFLEVREHQEPTASGAGVTGFLKFGFLLFKKYFSSLRHQVHHRGLVLNFWHMEVKINGKLEDCRTSCFVSCLAKTSNIRLSSLSNSCLC